MGRSTSVMCCTLEEAARRDAEKRHTEGGVIEARRSDDGKRKLSGVPESDGQDKRRTL